MPITDGMKAHWIFIETTRSENTYKSLNSNSFLLFISDYPRHCTRSYKPPRPKRAMNDPMWVNSKAKAKQDKRNICLVGSGGVGTITSLVLEKSGHANVTAVLRSTYAVVKERGWDIDSVDHGILKEWQPTRGKLP